MMLRRHHAPPTAAHGRAVRWFWRLMRFGPVLTLLIDYTVFHTVWFIHGGVVRIPTKMEGWSYNSEEAHLFSYGLLLALSCFAIAGVNAISLWIAGPARFFALWWSAPIFLDFSNHSMRQALGCTSYQLSAISTLCQFNADLRLPFPDMWPLAMPWPLT